MRFCASMPEKSNFSFTMCMNIFFLLFCLVSRGEVMALDVHKQAKELVSSGISAGMHTKRQLQEARAYYNLGQFGLSEKIDLQMIEESSLDWEKNILRYNLATSYAAQGKWESALEQFAFLYSKGNLSPDLTFRYQVNVAVSFIGWAKDILQKEDDIHLSGFLQEIFRVAEKIVEAAEKSFCDFKKWEGYEHCEKSKELNEVKKLLILDNKSSQMFLSEVEERLKKLNSVSENPIEILKQTIQMQQIALDLSFLFFGWAVTDEIPEKMKRLFLDAQNFVNQFAPQFVDVVLNWQKKEYAKQPYSEACQEKPWNRVIPLYNEGLSVAKLALDLQKTFQIERIIIHQKQAIAYWKEALDIMENRSEAGNVENPIERNKKQQIIQQVIKMNNMDRQPKTSSKMNSETIEKSW